ncbi:MAG: hypothetical protein KatS3mg108_3342 [Isosphaeraceae bacterium]|jgi:ABC-type Fe3+ transport system permease subunit|nr:MAG: hypothetical protein KatS3mg108_3342 [Isosphaeraceae bacterium]
MAAAWAPAVATPLLLALSASFGLASVWPPRLRAFSPLAWGLIGFDPACRRLLVDSLGFAACVSLLAAGLGTLGAEWCARRCPPFATWLAAATLPAVVPPAALALGLRQLVNQSAWPGIPYRRLALAYVCLLWAAPLAAASILPVRRAIGQGWRERGRLYGGRLGTARAWCTAVAPCIRPPMARAIAVVFLLCLFEPGAPLALEIQNLAAPRLFQEALSAPGPLVSALTLTTLAAGWGVLFLARWLGGRPATVPHSRQPPPSPHPRPGRLAADALGLLACALIWWTPLVLLGAQTLSALKASGQSAPTLAEQFRTTLESLRSLPLRPGEAEALSGLLTSAGLTLMVVTVLLAAGWIQPARARLWDLRGISLVPGLAAAIALTPVQPILAPLVITLPLAHSLLGGAVRPATHLPETETILGVPALLRWWHFTGQPAAPRLVQIGVAITGWALLDTTILPLTSALGASSGGLGTLLIGCLALGGPPQLASPSALVMAALALSLRLAGLPLAWFGAWPTPDTPPAPTRPSPVQTHSRTIR